MAIELASPTRSENPVIEPLDSPPATPAPEVAAQPPASVDASPKLDIRDLNVYYGQFRAVRDVTLAIPGQSVTAIIGPSGCGKSSFLRTLNRMHELISGATVSGQALLDGVDIYGAGVDPVQLRRIVGMVFQRPNPFPTMSIYDNVVAGVRLTGRHSRAELDQLVESSLQRAALWNEVDRKSTRLNSSHT